MNVLDVARIAHKINKAYCESLGDTSQPSWEDVPDWQRESAIKGVRHYCENPGLQPPAIHAYWLKEKLLTGWKYGVVKDPEKKEHPSCVPYDQLSEEEKTKDYLFSSIVGGLARFVRLEVDIIG